MKEYKFVYRKEGLKLTKPEEIVVEQREDIKALRDELWLYKTALKMACKIILDFTGNCPYDQFNLDMPNDCEEQCLEQMKRYYCWDRFFIAQAKEIMKSE